MVDCKVVFVDLKSVMASSRDDSFSFKAPMAAAAW